MADPNNKPRRQNRTLIQYKCEHCKQAFYRRRLPPSKGKHCSRECLIASFGSLEKRFWDKVNKDGPTVRPDLGPCWVWTAATNAYGYGVIKTNGVSTVAPRVSWEMVNGPLVANHCALHKCDNPPCVRPEHLFSGTKKDNVQDMVQKGRNHTGKGRAKLDGVQVKSIRVRYATGAISQQELAAEHGVSFSAISKIIHRRTWPRL